MSQTSTPSPDNTPFHMTSGLGRTLLISFVILALVPIALVAVIGTSISLQTAQDGAFARLGAVADVKVQAIEDWLGERQHDLQVVLLDSTTENLVRAALSDLSNSNAASTLTDRLTTQLHAYQSFSRFFVIDSAGMSSISTDSTLIDHSHATETYFTRGLLGPYITAIKNNVTGLYDTIAIAAPIVDNGNRAIGVLVGEANLDQLSRIVLTGLGTTRSDDSYLVGQDGRFLTQSHYPHKKDSGDINQTIGVSAALEATAGIGGQALYNNYVDQPVIGVYRIIPALHVVLITEQLTSDALAGTQKQGLLSLGVSALAASIAVASAFLVTRRIVQPVAKLTQVATRIATGDLNQTAVVVRRDEIGVLAQTFNSMTAQMRSLISTLEQNVQARTSQLKASSDVGRAVTSILDTDHLLREVVNLITERFDFYYAAVFLTDDTSRYAVLREATGDAGRTLKQVGHKLEIGGQSMVGTAINLREARIALDVGKEAIRFANPLLPYTRSEIALPLMVGDRVIGALDVQSQQAAAFDESSAEVLQSMADQIAIALLNAESFSRTERQARTLAVLNQLSRELAMATSMEAIGHISVSTVVGLVGPSRLFVALNGNDPNLLSIQEYLADAGQPLGSVQTMPRINTVIGQALQTRRTIYLPDLEEAAQHYHDAAVYLRQGIRSGVAIPMLVGEQTLGTFNVGRPEKDSFSTDQISQLEQVAAQLAIAIENRELLQRMQATLSELDAVNRRLIGQAWDRYTRTTASLSAEWREGRWLPLSDPNALPDSGVRIPIRVRGETIGEFSLIPSGAHGEWTSEDVAFAQSLVDQVGQTIENARLFEETERLAQRERTINDINSRVRQTIKMDTILETAVNELARSLNAKRVFARIGGHDHDIAGSGNGEGVEHA